MKSDPGIRNLEQLQEEEDDRRMPRGVVAAFVVVAGACVIFAALALGGRAAPPHDPKPDPLGDLVTHRLVGAAGGSGSRAEANAVDSASRPPEPADLGPKDVSFPQMLSDEGRPTTALAAVHPGASAASASSVAPPAPLQPPPATDRLPVIPLPAQAVLEATPVVTRPRDPLTKVASDAAQITTPPISSEAAPAGHDGGYQLQISSFHTSNEAESFAEQLRVRGHKAYVMEAHVAGRGTWYRVRIGPFPTQHAATQYRASFEEREHVVPFIVPPETTAKAH